MKKFNYYKEQLDKIKLSQEGYFSTLIVSDDQGTKTKNLSINFESIPEIRKFLDRMESELKKREKREN